MNDAYLEALKADVAAKNTAFDAAEAKVFQARKALEAAKDEAFAVYATLRRAEVLLQGALSEDPIFRPGTRIRLNGKVQWEGMVLRASDYGNGSLVRFDNGQTYGVAFGDMKILSQPEGALLDEAEIRDFDAWCATRRDLPGEMSYIEAYRGDQEWHSRAVLAVQAVEIVSEPEPADNML